MFGRASSLTTICLRCQRRIARQLENGYETGIRHRTPLRPSIRWQSTAAALFEDDDHDQPGQTHEPGSQRQDVVPPEDHPPSRPARNFRLRRVQLTPTADLGVDVLGKPSEIILLNQKDRAIPIVPTDSEATVGGSLHDSLVSEKQPLSWEQIKENIEHVHASLGQPRGSLTAPQWISLKSSLVNGFTRAQLKRYSFEAKLIGKFRISAGKEWFIRLLATKLWGYEIPKDDPADASKSNAIQRNDEISTRSLTINTIRKPAIETYARTLRHYQNLDFTFKTRQVAVKGPLTDVNNAISDLKTYAKCVKQVPISTKSYLGNIVTWSAHSLELLAEYLTAKYLVYVSIKKTKKEVIIILWEGPDQGPRVQEICRELRSIAAFSLSTTPWAILGPTRGTIPTKLSLGSAHPAESLPWNNFGPLGRLFDAVPSQKSSGKGGGDPRSLPRKLATRALDMPSAVNEQGVEVEFTARYGQALFSTDSRLGHAQFSREVLENRSPHQIFTSSPALVPQLFANAKFRDPASSAFDEIYSHGTLARMKLVPQAQDSDHPTIELLMVGSDPSAGLQQPFERAQATLILKEKKFLVARPGRAMDIELTAQTRLTISDDPQSSGSELLAALNTYMIGQRSLPALTTLPISKGWAMAVANDAPKAVTGQSTDVPYVLDSFHTLQTDARLAPLKADTGLRFPLEHIYFKGQEQGHHNEELVLRGSQVREGFKFSRFFDTAVDVADRLDDMGRQLKSRLEGIK
jgi:hypothetical protein